MAVPWNTKAEWPELNKVSLNTKVTPDVFNKIVYTLLRLSNRKGGNK